MAHSVQGCGRSRASRKEEPTGGTAVETSGTLRMQKTPPGLVPKEVSVSLMVSCRGSKERYCHLGRNQVKTGRKEWLKRMSENFPKKREKRNKDGGVRGQAPSVLPPSERTMCPQWERWVLGLDLSFCNYLTEGFTLCLSFLFCDAKAVSISQGWRKDKTCPSLDLCWVHRRSSVSEDS